MKEQKLFALKSEVEAFRVFQDEQKQKLLAQRARLELAVLEAHRAGASISELCRAYGTSARNTIYDIIKRDSHPVNAKLSPTRKAGEKWIMELIDEDTNTYQIQVSELGNVKWSGTTEISFTDSNDILFAEETPLEYWHYEIRDELIKAHKEITGV